MRALRGASVNQNPMPPENPGYFTPTQSKATDCRKNVLAGNDLDAMLIRTTSCKAGVSK
jgi:hypothetical protein